MASFMEVYRRIQSATQVRTQGELAKILAVQQSSISDAKRRNTIPPRWYLTLSEKFGLHPCWLRYGTGPMYLRTDASDAPQEFALEGRRDLPSHKYSESEIQNMLVTVYSMCRHSGEDRVPELNAVEKIVLPSFFVGPDTLVLRMRGNNMGATVRIGAYFGVNIADFQPFSGGVFVLKDEQQLLVRRIFRDYGNKNFLLRSDSEKHIESVVPAEGFSERIVGRVSWVMQEVF